MSNSQTDTLFAKWLDNTLTKEERSEFERLCIENPDFAKQVETANQFSVMAEQYQRQPVPQWNMDATFEAPEQPKWWQWQGLGALSMAMSAAAMVLVISGFNVQVSDGKMSLGFQHGPSDAEIAAVVDKKLNQYQDANQALFAKYVDALQTQQQENSTQLTQYLLSSSRQERREDFAELIKFINQQRDDDQRYYARQLTKLQQEINSIDTPYLPTTE